MLPFPCAVIKHIRFIGYDLSRAVRHSTPNSDAKLSTVFIISKSWWDFILSECECEYGTYNSAVGLVV